MQVNYRYLTAAGFFIYATVFMLWSLMTTYDFVYGIQAQLASYAVTALMTFFATRFVDATNANAWVYGAIWALIYIALDVVLVVPVAGIESLGTSFNLISYGVILLIPIIVAAIAGMLVQRGAAGTQQNTI
ncbi:MAG: hypothetical protein AAB480_01195 [Patescibacteria group bacterium]